MKTRSVTLPRGAQQAHLFDMDGTLIVSDPALGLAWRTWAETVGVTPHTPPWTDIVTLGRAKKVVDFMNEYVTEFGSVEAKERLSDRAVLLQEESKWFELQLEPARKGIDGVVAIRGAAEYFNRLVDAGEKVAVYSATWPGVAQGRLVNAGFNIDNVTFIHPSDLTAGKPDPEGYLDAAAAVGVPIDRCVVYEDAAKGMTAGKASGAYVVGVRTTNESDENLFALCDVVVPDFTHVSRVSAGVRFRGAQIPTQNRLGTELALQEL